MNEKQRNEVEEAIRKSPIFKAVGNVGALLDDPDFHVEAYSSGQVIFSPETKESELALIVKGRVEVTKNSGGKTVFLKRAEAGEAFGVAGLFGGGTRYASRVTACARQTKIAFWPQDAIERLMRREPDVAVSYITFLSDRIRYLNEKIDSFAEPDTLVKLSEYLLKENAVDGGMQKLSDALAVSRATLYRQITKLEERGAVQKDGKNVVVKDPEILKQIVKGK